MRRVIAIAILGAGLGGCSSMPSWSVTDYFKSTPPAIQVQLESQPPGADAKTSVGPGCKTPCSVQVSTAETGFSVTFTLPRFQPMTVPVQVITIKFEPKQAGAGVKQLRVKTDLEGNASAVLPVEIEGTK